MEMVVLHTEMEDPKALVGGRTERTEDGREDPAGSQAADGTPAAQGDMHRVRGGVRGPRAVRDAGTAARGELSAGAGAASTPGAWRREAKLQGARHLDSSAQRTEQSRLPLDGRPRAAQPLNSDSKPRYEDHPLRSS